MKLNLTKNQKVAFTNAIKAANNLYKGNITEAFNYIFDSKISKNQCEELKNILAGEHYIFEVKDVILDTVDNMIDTEKHIFKLCDALDLVIRIALGQWNELININKNNKILFMEDKLEAKVFLLRDSISFYKDNNISGRSASLGIGSDALIPDIKIIYDIFKTLMFENGAGGCYAYEPTAFSDEPKPIIKLPYQKEFLNVTKKDLDYIKRVCKFYHEGKEGLFLGTGEYVSHLVMEGDNVYLKRNNYVDIENTKPLA